MAEIDNGTSKFSENTSKTHSIASGSSVKPRSEPHFYVDAKGQASLSVLPEQHQASAYNTGKASQIEKPRG